MSITYSLELCYGVIVPDEIMEKIYQLTEEKFDDFRDNYANQINVVQGFNAIQQAISALGYQMDSCCCSIKTQMLQDKYEALENQYRTAQNDLSNAAQSQYILNALGRFVAYPPAAATIATQG